MSDEQTFGRIRANKVNTPYWANRMRGSIEASDAWAFDVAASVTHYDASSVASATSIFQLMLGTSYAPNDHWAFDVDAFVSPSSSSTERGIVLAPGTKGAIRDRTSARGFDLAAEYDTAGDSNAESAFGLSLGANSYSTTQRTRVRDRGVATQAMFGAPEQAALLQWRADASFTETLYRDTDIGLIGTYYIYNRDTAQSGYHGETVFGRAVGDGIPVAPLQYSARASLTQRFGALQLRGHAQYGAYSAGEGSSAVFGLKAQYKLTHALRVWLGGNLQLDHVSGAALNNLATSIGLRLLF